MHKNDSFLFFAERDGGRPGGRVNSSKNVFRYPQIMGSVVISKNPKEILAT